MSNKQRVKAAVTSLLDEIKRTQPQTIDDVLLHTTNEKNAANPNMKSAIPINNIIKDSPTRITYELKTIDPASCARWKLANRQFINKENCEELITNIKLL